MSNYNKEPDHLIELTEDEFWVDFFMFVHSKPERRQVHEGFHFKYNLMMWEARENIGVAIKEHLGEYTYHRYGDPKIWKIYRERFFHEHRGD